MSVTQRLRRLDERVLGHPGSSGTGTGVRGSWRGVWHGVCGVSRLVLVLMAAVLVLAVVLVALPSNEGNVLVRAVLRAAAQVGQPFATLFEVERRPVRAAANYGTGAAVYLLAAALVGRLPGARG